MNSENSKTSDPHRLLLNFPEKKGYFDRLLYQILTCAKHEKYKESHTKTINLKYLCQRGMNNLNDMMDYIVCQVFKIILSIPSKT